MSFLVLTYFTQSYNNDISIEHPGSFQNLSTNYFNYVSEILKSKLDAYESLVKIIEWDSREINLETPSMLKESIKTQKHFLRILHQLNLLLVLHRYS